MVGGLAAEGLASSTRRGDAQVFKGFHRFLQSRKAVEIDALFGVRLICPVDEFNTSRHVGDESPAVLPPPTPERVTEFFEFLKGRIATARKYAPSARHYGLFRTLYHAGLRAEESSLLERSDAHFSRGPFGKLHVRFGKGAHTSGPRPRWVPMLDGLDLVLRWFRAGCPGPRSRIHRCCFPTNPGGRTASGLDPESSPVLMELEGRPAAEWFSPHALRRACATHNYERGVDLVAIQQLLGHWTVSSTCRRYVRPSATFIEDAYRRAVTTTVNELTGEEVSGQDARSVGSCGWPPRSVGMDRGAHLRRLLVEKAGLELSSASVSALLTKDRPGQAVHPGRALHCSGLHPERPFRGRHDTTGRPADSRPGSFVAESRCGAGRSMPPI